MRGLSAETILNYPRPEPMPSAGYEKAQQILQKVPQAQEEGSQKEAGIRPDRMEPGYDTLLGAKKRKKQNGQNAERIKSFGAHTLGGAGAAKFLHDWVDQGHMAYGKPKTTGRFFKKTVHPGPSSAKTKFLVISGGAGLGALEYARKRLKKHKEEKAMKTKTSGVGNLGAEEYAEFKAKVLTRAAAQAEAEALFDKANVARAQAQRVVKGHFVQADGAETMAPTLTKKASAQEPGQHSHVEAFFDKLAEARLTDAQRRYPELLKASMAPGGLGTAPAPALGKRPARTTPAASMMSGGTP